MKYPNNLLTSGNGGLGWAVKSIAAFAFCAITAVNANATVISNATVTGQSGSAAGCIAQVGVGGAALEWTTTGAYLNAASGTTSGCYVGSVNTVTGAVAAGSEALYIALGGSSGEGSAADLGLLATGWYALGFFSSPNGGAICGGTAQCTNSNANDGSNSSGEIDMLVNRTGAPVVFTVKNAAGIANGIANLPSASGCGAAGTGSTNTYTVAANTICFSDLTTGGSISITVAAPSTVPEPASSALIGLGLCGVALLARRKSSRS
jgi:PEP-CTERM motif-containing protein